MQRPLTLLTCAIIAEAILVMIGWCGVSLAEGPAKPASFSADARSRIDDNAVWGSRERVNKAGVEATGSLLEWLVVHAPLPADEERRRADSDSHQTQAKFQTSETPVAAQKVYDDLIVALPTRMRPPKDQSGTATVENAERHAWLVGLGRVYLDKAWLETVLADERTGRDQLAFVIANELGHGCLGHARRRWQRTWLEEELRKDVARKELLPSERAKKLKILENLRGVGGLLEGVYTREEDYQADLFAVHLCRNAGFNVENGLDVLRAAAVAKDRALLNEPPPRTGTPPVEPEIQPKTTHEQITLASQPPAAHRLRRLRLELDGLGFGEFGLFEFNRETKSFTRAVDASVPADARAVVCVHGMESSREVWLPLLNRMAEEPAAERLRLFAFQYPADDRLARSGQFLKREVQRVFGSAKQIDFVVHSAGGLVFRWYAEVASDEFHLATFLGTPHLASDLSHLRRLLEVVQFVGDLPLGFDSALQNAILDGRGQISFDLQPESLFLTYLNRVRPNLHRDQYAIHRGKALSRTRAFVLQTSVDAGRVAPTRTLDKESDPLLTKFKTPALEAFVLPQEIVDGDLCVRCDSALLDGVKSVETHSLKHTSLPRDAGVISLVLKRLIVEP